MKVTFVRALLFAAILAVLAVLSTSATGMAGSGTESAIEFDDFHDPPTEYRPWVRWWWPGGDVEEEELKREVRLLAGHGFGGVEIQAFTMGLDPRPGRAELEKRHSYDTPDFYAKLAAVMEEAEKAGLMVDINLGSGWPSGGPHVPPEDSLLTLLWSERTVKGPKSVTIKLKDPKKPLFYRVTPLVEFFMKTEVMEYYGDDAELVAVVAGRKAGGKRSRSPVDLSDAIEIEPGSALDLTDKVENGKVEWNAPPGEWVVVFIYQAPNGEAPTLTATEEAGLVPDHFNRDAIMMNVEHFAGERTGLPGYYGAPFRAFFNDSFEFKAERHFARDFMEEFEKRRGYDPATILPAVLVPGGDNFFMHASGLAIGPEYRMSEDDARARYDYSHTISDLFIERCLKPLSEWAGQRGLLSRAQGYGMDMDVIKAQGNADIPETEQLYSGGSEMFLKMASAGACLYNRPLVTAESFVWAGMDYMTTPAKIKAAADKLFTSGINGIIYHGYTYKKDGSYGEAGWYPWSSRYSPMGAFSSNMSEANPYWKHLPRLNRYMARCQYLLRKGKPSYDLVVYYPWLGFPPAFSTSGHKEILFNGRFLPEDPDVGGNGLDSIVPTGDDGGTHDPRVFWLETVWPLLKELEEDGWTWTWANDESLAEAKLDQDGKIVIRGSIFGAAVIANTQYMRPEAAENLARLSEEGAAFLLMGSLPAKQPGLHNKDAGDARVRESTEKILASKRAATYGRIGTASASLVTKRVVPSSVYMGTIQPLRKMERKLEDGSRVMFFWNLERVAMSFPLGVTGGCKSAVWMNPMDGNAYPAASAVDPETGMPYLRGVMDPLGSIFLVCSPHSGDDPAVKSKEEEKGPYWKKKSDLGIPEITGLESWNLVVSGEDVPGGNVEIVLDELRDWREIKKLMHVSSPGVYKTTFEINDLDSAKLVEIDLGWVNGTADVRVNGKDGGTLIVPPFGMNINELVREGDNTLEVTVTPPLRNRYVGYGDGPFGNRKYRQFKGRPLAPSGMTGPAAVLVWR